MELNNTIDGLIIIHAVLGFTALLSGAIALSVKKGGNIHRRSGRVFFYSMLISGLIALLVSNSPGHENMFLFCIGIFSLYFLLSAYSILRFRKASDSLTYDWILAIVSLLTGTIMIFYPILLEGRLNIVLLVFGIIGLIFGTRDLLSFRNKEHLVKNRIRLHLGKMIGAYIAATTAFFVVNALLPGVWGWFLPGIVGGTFIAYYLRKTKPIGDR